MSTTRRKLPPGIDELPSGKLRARYRDETGKLLSKSFAPNELRIAQRWRTDQISKVNAGTHVEGRKGLTVAEYAREWAASRPHREGTARRIHYMLKVHVEGTPLGARPLASVRSSEVQAWATGRSQSLAPSTLRSVVKLLRSIFTSAVEDRLIAASPVSKRLSLPTAEKSKVVPLTVAQVRELADAMPERYRAMVIVQAALGLRIGELLALQVGDVNFLRREVRIERQIPPRSKTFTAPKTPSSTRTLPLPQIAAQSLAAHLASCPAGADGVIFTGKSGRPLTHTYYAAGVYNPAVKRAGLPAGTTSHDLRHHYASVLLAAGESVVAVAERLGHDSASLVLTTYGHLLPDTEESTRRAVDAAWNQDRVMGESQVAGITR